MRFTTRASNLIAAERTVSIIPAEPLLRQSTRLSAFYRFRVFHENGKLSGYMYSRNAVQVARARLELDDLEGEGDVALPVHVTAIFAAVPDDTITIDIDIDDDKRVAVISSTGGLRYELPTYDPRLIAPCERDLESVIGEAELSVAPLREGLTLARSFLPEAGSPLANDPDKAHFCTVQVFDGSNTETANGNGCMFASDGTRALFFQSAFLEGSGFAVHQSHLTKLIEFLGKSSGQVCIRRCANMTYAVRREGDQIIGWTRLAKSYQRCAYPSSRHDRWIFRLPKAATLGAIDAAESAIQYAHDSHVRLVYTYANPTTGGNTLHFSTASACRFQGALVATIEKPPEVSAEESFDFMVHLGHFRSLFAAAKGNEVELRVATVPPSAQRRRPGGQLRTVEGFTIDGHECTVTRYMSSTV
jgi:hypothetical protein